MALQIEPWIDPSSDILKYRNPKIEKKLIWTSVNKREEWDTENNAKKIFVMVSSCLMSFATNPFWQQTSYM